VAVTSSPSKVIQGGLLIKPQVSVSGSAVTGKQLAATTETPSMTSASYQWLRNGKSIAGATSTKYTLTSTDFKTTVSVRVTFTRVGYENNSTTSPAVRVAIGELTKTPDSSITGSARVNQTLSAKTGTWDSGVKLSFQWLRDGVNIPKATGKTYRLTASDRRKEIVLRVRATKTGYESVTIDSRAVVVR
jgi:hypothetical protein